MTTSELRSPEIRTNVRYVLTARGRLVLAASLVVLVALLAAAVAFFFATPSAAAGEKYEGSFTQVTVSEGENLWDLAQENAPSDMDIRDYIALVKDVNGLDSSVIRPGQTIAFPQG